MRSFHSYSRNFYRQRQEGSLTSAQNIVPLVLEYLQPKSVIDVGCGLGTWLAVFQSYGIVDILGLDGNHIDTKMLEIPKKYFSCADFRKPLPLGRTFDLVLSLEVAEHLPEEKADLFINSLTNLGRIILFSAAIPYQGGTNHLNLQWPDYWAQLFLKRRYLAVDCFRKRIWNNKDIEYWYAQDLLLFVQADTLDEHPKLKKEYEYASWCPLSIVHPEQYLSVARASAEEMSLGDIVPALPRLIYKSLKNRLAKSSSKAGTEKA